MAQEQPTTSGGTIIQINEDQIKDHLGEIVSGVGHFSVIICPLGGSV